MPKSALRRRVAPFVSVLIEYQDENGAFSELYRLSFNLNVLAEISLQTGLTALTFDIWIRMSASVLRAMFWAALVPHQRQFASADGMEIAGSMLNGESQEKIIEALWQAYLLYLPKEQAELMRKKREEAMADEANPPGSPAPTTANLSAETGSSSGASADTISDSPKALPAS